MATSNRYVAGSLIWTALLTLVASRRSHRVAREALPAEWRARYPPLRWSRTFRELAREFLPHLLARLRRERIAPEPIYELAGRVWVRAQNPNISPIGVP